jgi:hypothetical protein
LVPSGIGQRLLVCYRGTLSLSVKPRKANKNSLSNLFTQIAVQLPIDFKARANGKTYHCRELASVIA